MSGCQQFRSQLIRERIAALRNDHGVQDAIRHALIQTTRCAMNRLYDPKPRPGNTGSASGLGSLLREVRNDARLERSAIGRFDLQRDFRFKSDGLKLAWTRRNNHANRQSIVSAITEALVHKRPNVSKQR